MDSELAATTSVGTVFQMVRIRAAPGESVALNLRR